MYCIYQPGCGHSIQKASLERSDIIEREVVQHALAGHQYNERNMQPNVRGRSTARVEIQLSNVQVLFVAWPVYAESCVGGWLESMHMVLQPRLKNMIGEYSRSMLSGYVCSIGMDVDEG